MQIEQPGERAEQASPEHVAPRPERWRAGVWGTVGVLSLLSLLFCYLKLKTDAGIFYDASVPFWVRGLFMTNAFISYFLLFVLAQKSRLAAYILLPCCLVTLILAFYIGTHYGTIMTTELVTAALETSWSQLSGFLSPALYAAIALGSVFLFGALWCMRRLLSTFPRLAAWKVWVAAVLYVGLSSLAFPVGVRYCPEAMSHLVVTPTDNVARDSPNYRSVVMARMQEESSHEYIYRAWLPFYRQLSAVYCTYLYYHVNPLQKAQDAPSHCVFSDRDLTVVLVIGESFRSDHAPWNGYGRNTLPKLSAFRGNIVDFPWFKSYATTTITSIYGMFSDATCSRRQASCTSFLGILKKHGFTNALAVSRTGLWYKNPQIITLIDGHFDSITTSSDNDEIVSRFERLAAAGGKKLIVLEDGTGHFPYTHEHRFTTYDESDPQNRINRYDNCLIQTDDLLSRLITCLQGQNAVLLYSSDHGQSFGEQGAYMHGGLLTVEKQRHVFSFVWYSDAYGIGHPEIIKNMIANRNKLLSHDDIYHSLLSLCGIQSTVGEPSLNFTRPLERPDAEGFSLEGESVAVPQHE